ncbi:MAG TPA: hypothetical protein DCY07_00670 [Rhodospirillaceae bacterium]|nr:hypothetical protein [Rhodospirillaceae bacterium]
MKQYRFIAILITVLVLLAIPRPASAQIFATPSMDNISKTLIRMGALDFHEDRTVDLYARVTNCALVQKSYQNDFEWEKVRRDLRDEIRREISTFPAGYAYEAPVKLGKYDFDRKLYSFVGQGGEINVNTFSMVTADKSFCADEKQYWLPSTYQLVLRNPVKIPGLFILEDDGRALLERLNQAGNLTHIIFMRINVRVVFVAGLASTKEIREQKKKRLAERFSGGKASVLQNIKSGSIRLDGELDSIEFYEDEDHKKLIYTYRPYDH